MPLSPDPVGSAPKRSSGPSFRRFFTRGLAILLPTVITIGLVIWAYGFISSTIAEPINRLVRYCVVEFTAFPEPTDRDYDEIFEQLDKSDQRLWEKIDGFNRDMAALNGTRYSAEQSQDQQRQWMRDRPTATRLARQHSLQARWDAVRLGDWVITDLIGIVIAIVLIFIVGVFLSNFVGRRLYAKGEELIARLPLVRRVYPSVKQVTDFFFGESETPMEFNRVVAVQYPRKGLWSVGLVTGATMRTIQEVAGQECLTVFVPSSPTPFTGYVITVPISDTVDLNVTIEEALKFAVSGGVLIPPSQEINPSPDGGSADNDNPGPPPPANGAAAPKTLEPATPTP